MKIGFSKNEYSEGVKMYGLTNVNNTNTATSKIDQLYTHPTCLNANASLRYEYQRREEFVNCSPISLTREHVLP